jgi:hypothetical protein
MRDLIEQEKIAEAVIRETTAELKQSGELPRTPLQLMVLLAEAGDAGNWERAGAALDMRYLPEELEGWPAAELIQALGIVWSQQNIVDITQLSDEPEGHLDDGLPPYRDLLGVVLKDDGTEVPIFLQRIPDGQGGKIWKISNASVAEIPALWADLGYGPIAVWLQKHLPDYRFAGMESWQLIAGVLFLVAAWYLSLLVSYCCMRVALLDPNRFPLGIEQFLRGPLRLFLFVLMFRLLMDQLALSLAARVYLNSSGVDYIAFSILILGIISLLRDYNIRRLERAGNRQYVALLKPFTTIVKFVALTIIGADLGRARRLQHVHDHRRPRRGLPGRGPRGAEDPRERDWRHHPVLRTPGQPRRPVPLRQYRRRGRGDRPALDPDPHPGSDHARRPQLRLLLRGGRELQPPRSHPLLPAPGAADGHRRSAAGNSRAPAGAVPVPRGRAAGDGQCSPGENRRGNGGHSHRCRYRHHGLPALPGRRRGPQSTH